MGLPAALIFDVDGTLADTERDGHRVAFNHAFAAAGLDWHWGVALYGELLHIGGGRERLRHFLADHPFDHSQGDDINGFIVALHQAKNRCYAALLGQGRIALRSGIARILNEARSRGIRLAIATTSVRENVEVLLSSTLGAEAMSWFDVIASADEVVDKKPSPAVYDYALAHLGLAAEQCLAFEDSRNGLVAAQRAGLRTIVTVNDYTRNDDFSAALLVVDQLGEPGQPLSVLGGVAASRMRDSASYGPGYLDMAALAELWR